MKHSIDFDYIRIQDIANGSDEEIKMFSKTPISDLLKQRREIARLYLEEKTNEGFEMLEYADNELRKFFFLPENRQIQK